MENKKDLIEMVTDKVTKMQEAGQLDLPKEYSAVNALRGAWLMMQDMTVKVGDNHLPVLEYCTRESIMLSLLRMVLDGLTPIKNQGAFIARGRQLTWMREYAGNLAIAKRTAGVIDASATVIWEGDIFQYGLSQLGVPYIIRHEQKFENIGTKILGAYAVIRRQHLGDYVEIMTFDQIKSAWAMSRNFNKAHQEFPDQMCKKTVLNRALKMFINSTSDENVLDQPQMPDPELPTLDHVTTQVATKLFEQTVVSQDPEPSVEEATISEQMERDPEQFLEETPLFEQMESDPEW